MEMQVWMALNFQFDTQIQTWKNEASVIWIQALGR